jgi:hypothetical protein
VRKYRLSLLSFALLTAFSVAPGAVSTSVNAAPTVSVATSSVDGASSGSTTPSTPEAPANASTGVGSSDSAASTSSLADGLSSSADLTPAQEAQVGTQLTDLEKRLFSEVYTTDTVEARLSRLEKFVFGGVWKGSITKRLSRLTMDIPPAAQAATPANAGTPAAASSTSSGSTSGANDSSGGGSDDEPSGEDYPTIDALEKAILGHTDQQLSLNKRLDNLEIKAFGKASPPNSDFALRVDKLKQYERAKGGGNDDYLAQETPTFMSSQPVQTLPITSQLDMLEKVVFAKTYPKDGVVSRIDRLEKTVYPSKPLDSFSSVPKRVTRLEQSLQINSASDTSRVASSSYVGGSNNAPTFQDTRQPQQKSHHSFLHKLGSVIGTIGEAAAMSMGSGMMYGGYPGYGGYGYGGGPMYGGMGGMGMGPGFYF